MELEEVANIQDTDRLTNGDMAATPKQVNVDIATNDPMLNADVVTGNQLFKQRLWALCKIR